MPVDPRSDTFETSDGCRIAFQLSPAQVVGAPRLALIHPLALDRSVWDGVVACLSGHIDLLTYDCRGHGRSSRPAMPFTIGLFARDLSQLLMHVGWNVATVAGCSMGGCVAQGFAADYPQMINGLGLIDTTAWYGADAPRRWRDRATMAREHGLAAMIEFQASRWFSDQFREQQPETVSRVSKVFLANDVGCYGETCSMLGQADLRPSHGNIRVPVSVVVGEEDYATPISMSQQMHDSIAGSTLTVLANVRHLAPVEAPEAIAQNLRALLHRAH
jgi:3-oxoadipate enol-lactonase